MQTLKTMDEMLKALVCEDQEPNLLVLQIILKEVEEFRVLGQLVGCLTLCCVEQEQEIWQSAVEGLHHLFSFMQLLKSKMLVKHGAEYRQILKDSQTERAFWVTNISNITSLFGKYFNPSEHGLPPRCYRRRERLQRPWRGDDQEHAVSEAVRSIHKHLDSISEPLARQELLRALLLLGSQFSEEVCCCGDVEDADIPAQEHRKILRELVSRLQGQAPRRHQLSQRPAGVASLAATRALYVILQEQACRQEVKELFPQLYVALLFHVTHTVQHTASQEREHNQEDTAAPLSPVRFAVKAMEALLLRWLQGAGHLHDEAWPLGPAHELRHAPQRCLPACPVSAAQNRSQQQLPSLAQDTATLPSLLGETRLPIACMEQAAASVLLAKGSVGYFSTLRCLA
ncbi:uncharacterized protein LOC120392935 [Mauremys reevesii]|uniref:uncharacterized protein LOC120392935 n=1 Tax=Mauremys reevesii TaxID=260615 RepID=UPI00193FF949|nr:uncharacterized protein LOC120392935 [Mauremys reevesii]